MKVMVFVKLFLCSNVIGVNRMLEGISDRGKLVIDIIKNKGLDDIRFIAVDNDIEEIIKITSFLQADNATFTTMILQYDWSMHSPYPRCPVNPQSDLAEQN